MILFYIFAAVVAINCFYYLLFSKFLSLKSSLQPVHKFPISVLICAKNEVENLKILVPKILEQTFTNFELILINDSSIDETLDVIEHFAEIDHRVKIVDVKSNEAFYGNKKYALTLGIKKALNNYLVFTDADCIPASNDWLAIMSSNFSVEKQLILGYGAYEKTSGFLNKLIRFETAMTAIQYFSYAAIGKPYMGVGRNLAYTSKLFYDNQGFMSHIKILSGDDDLFVNKAANKNNTALCINQNAFTISKPKTTFKSWRKQKQRHISTSKMYKKEHKIWLGLYYVANLLFWLFFVASLLSGNWKITLIIFVFRILFQYIIVGKAAKKLNEYDLVPFVFILELFLVFFQFGIFINSKTSKKQHWK